MFKSSFTTLTSQSSFQDLTDYFEFQCIKAGEISIHSEINKLLLTNDEIQIEGIKDETDEAFDKVEEITQEIQRRQEVSGGTYPFALSQKGYVLSVEPNTLPYWVYVYLLFSTQLNMKTHKIWNSIDGTKILENLSALVVKNYFGERSRSLVFGTATSGGFTEKVNDLCKKMGEGNHFESHGNSPVSQQDDKLDVVVWIDFSDQKQSKFIGFGQCKTGTTFDDQATIELQPKQFCQKWFRTMPVVEPFKIFFCSQNYSMDYSKLVNAGLVFDRLRIMDFLPSQIDEKLSSQIKSWCEAVVNELKI